jgi:hypothetical protein
MSAITRDESLYSLQPEMKQKLMKEPNRGPKLGTRLGSKEVGAWRITFNYADLYLMQSIPGCMVSRSPISEPFPVIAEISPLGNPAM